MHAVGQIKKIYRLITIIYHLLRRGLNHDEQESGSFSLVTRKPVPSGVITQFDNVVINIRRQAPRPVGIAVARIRQSVYIGVSKVMARTIIDINSPAFASAAREGIPEPGPYFSRFRYRFTAKRTFQDAVFFSAFYHLRPFLTQHYNSFFCDLSDCECPQVSVSVNSHSPAVFYECFHCRDIFLQSQYSR